MAKLVTNAKSRTHYICMNLPAGLNMILPNEIWQHGRENTASALSLQVYWK